MAVLGNEGTDPENDTGNASPVNKEEPSAAGFEVVDEKDIGAPVITLDDIKGKRYNSTNLSEAIERLALKEGMNEVFFYDPRNLYEQKRTDANTHLLYTKADEGNSIVITPPATDVSEEDDNLQFSLNGGYSIKKALDQGLQAMEGKTGRIQIPINQNNHYLGLGPRAAHWVHFEVDVKDGKLSSAKITDSQGGLMRRSYSLSPVEQALDRVFPIKTHRNPEYEGLSKEYTGQQKDDINCGRYVLAHTFFRGQKITKNLLESIDKALCGPIYRYRSFPPPKSDPVEAGLGSKRTVTFEKDFNSSELRVRNPRKLDNVQKKALEEKIGPELPQKGQDRVHEYKKLLDKNKIEDLKKRKRELMSKRDSFLLETERDIMCKIKTRSMKKKGFSDAAIKEECGTIKKFSFQDVEKDLERRITALNHAILAREIAYLERIKEEFIKSGNSSFAKEEAEELNDRIKSLTQVLNRSSNGKNFEDLDLLDSWYVDENEGAYSVTQNDELSAQRMGIMSKNKDLTPEKAFEAAQQLRQEIEKDNDRKKLLNRLSLENSPISERLSAEEYMQPIRTTEQRIVWNGGKTKVLPIKTKDFQPEKISREEKERIHTQPQGPSLESMDDPSVISTLGPGSDTSISSPKKGISDRTFPTPFVPKNEDEEDGDGENTHPHW